MVACEEIIHFLDNYLNSAQITDASQNGLQVQGPHQIGKIALGVSAGLEFFRRAKACGAQLCIVHHGLLWGSGERLTGTFGERVKYLFKNDMGLAAYHLPLDMHPVIGHNACLIQAVGAKDITPFGNYHGQTIGFKGRTDTSLSDLRARLENYCQTQGNLLAYGKEHIQTVGIVSGGAWSMLSQAIEQKLDLYVTGALDEPAQELCREAQINCLALGHYNSEKAGIIALGKLLQEKFPVETQFIEVANPL